MADIWALTFSDVVMWLQEKKEEEINNPEINETENDDQKAEETTTVENTETYKTVEESVEEEKQQTLEDINKELEAAWEKQDLHKKVEELVEENKKQIEEQQKKPISPEVAEQLEQILPSFYKMYDEVVDERNRYKIAFETLSWKYEKLLTDNEEMKYQIRKTWDVDDDIRYLAKLRKDESASDEYADNLIWELAKTYKVNEYELKKDIKEKRQRQLQALSGVVETKTTIEEEQPEEKQPLFSGFKINNNRVQKK